MQTVDLATGVWRVREWVDPVSVVIDQNAVRSALLQAIGRWTAKGEDAGLDDELRKGASVEVVRVNPERGVLVESFPRQWRCRSCGRISDDLSRKCACGAVHKAQMHFVAYHRCGALEEPMLPRCEAHHAVAVRLPGTTSLSEIQCSCPVCHRPLKQGFIPKRCGCGGGYMRINVHRAATVYSPQFTVLVNPPDPEKAARFRAGGGAARALDWVLGGMSGREPTTDVQTVAGLVETLVKNGFSEATAREVAAKAAEKGEISQGSGASTIRLFPEAQAPAQEQALALAFAVSDGRTKVSDLSAGVSPPLKMLYEYAYPQAVAAAKLEAVEFLPQFPVATLAYGYTRDDTDPNVPARLATFRDRGRLRAYGTILKTEGLLFRLDPLAVHTWMIDHGLLTGAPAEIARDARVKILENVVIPTPYDTQTQAAGRGLLELTHSFAHRVIRRLSAFAGIERDALAEYLLPYHLAFVVYAAGRGEFILGGLQAVFETSLHDFLGDLLAGERRCPMDPACSSGGGACMACLHLGEPSCRYFNRFLDRRLLFGSQGLL